MVVDRKQITVPAIKGVGSATAKLQLHKEVADLVGGRGKKEKWPSAQRREMAEGQRPREDRNCPREETDLPKGGSAAAHRCESVKCAMAEQWESSEKETQRRSPPPPTPPRSLSRAVGREKRGRGAAAEGCGVGVRATGGVRCGGVVFDGRGCCAFATNRQYQA